MRIGWVFYIVSVMLSVLIGALLFLVVQPEFGSQSNVATSPLPPSLSLNANKEVSTLDIWQPQENVTDATLPLTATSALSYDLTSRQFLLEKNISQQLPMASLTKIMTATVAMEHPKKDDKYLVQQSALVGEDSMGLTVGEVLSKNELLYGLMLHSGNDAAEVLADNFPGGRSAFIKAMNDKAVSLGLINTHFTNPTGLEGDGKQYTTARDLLVMTQYAMMHFPEFVLIIKTFDYTIPHTTTHQEYDLENETNLLTSYPGVEGVKTGYTPEAGLCLVTYLNYSGHQIIAVILGSENRRQEMKDILDFSLKKIGITPPRHG